MERTYIKDTINKIGKKVTLYGWIETVRDHGKISFIDLRDVSAVVQCVTTSGISGLTPESVVSIVGTVKERPQKMINERSVTGTVEIDIEEIIVLNQCKELPIPIDTKGDEINEEMRLKHRYLDLRRNRMKNILKLRSDFSKEVRQILAQKDFTEVETPILTKSTKEGARDFIVPSRHHPGKFYALPQSPQQYKQLLMTAGVEKYFQFARCIRDEDLRADRGYEHTQIDLELSFVTQQDVMNTVEDIISNAVMGVGGILKDKKFPVIEYSDAIKKYGADKFDLRSDKEKENGVLAFAWVINFPFFKKVDKSDAAEVADGKSGWTFTHNPFSQPIDEHLDWHLKGENIDKILTTQYDLVCNGYEVGGGSIRAHKKETVIATFKTMGYTKEEASKSVGHMLDAFTLGTPPHGGIGLGLDRLVMLLANESSLKEVIAFPMTSSGKTAVMDAPSEVEDKLLKELKLKTIAND